MNLLSILCMVLSLAFLVTGAGFFVLSRIYPTAQSFEEKADHPALSDQGDRVLWEMGQGRSFVDKDRRTDPLSRRSFFARAALSLSAMLISSRMAHGLTVMPSLPKPSDGADPTGSGTPKGATSSEEDGQQDHTDTHNDFDVHSDNMISHQDTTLKNGHYDVPHSDFISTHIDTHNDVDN